ncbi:LAME_0H18206g1_1 [Lachancea meyersii CBS 8951]|uniref:LAME_0H18206g1_1 n=1 Tax=Lachancea meyersii CBS 8951 TaxID=1266667 RepID=A0A1G4KIV1_9SACH|nr:LAME_0H18206g1_1 [Lachancea meyersii CBS 8951]
MGKGSARSSGWMPSNTLSEPRGQKHNNEPKRYTSKLWNEAKRDTLENELVVGLSTGEYFPDVSGSGTRVPSIPSKRLRVDDTIGDDFKRNDTGIEYSYVPKTHRDLNPAFGDTCTKNAGETYGNSSKDRRSQGLFRAIHHSGAETVKNPAVLVFKNSEDITMSIKWKGERIGGTEVDFLKDCQTVFFSVQGNHLGVVLKCSRITSLHSDQTNIFLWTEKGQELVPHIKEVLERSFVDVIVVEGEKVSDHAVISAMKRKALAHGNASVECTLQESSNYTREHHPFQGKELRSLAKPFTKSRNKGTSTIIGVPSSADFPDGHTTSPGQFYGNNSSHVSLLNHTLSNVKRVTRSSTATPPTTADTEETDIQFETPEIFKPALFYKFEDKTTLSITNQDFKCLYNHDWINDSILDFFVKYWTENSIQRGIIIRDQIHVLSSFFYTKLISNPDNYYGNVKKWVRDTDLFKNDYVVMPINESFHWFGCIIWNLPALFSFLIMERDFKLKHQSDGINSDIENNDELSVTSPTVSIMIYDSLRQTHSREVEPIKEFLIAYAADKYQLEVLKPQIKMKTCMVPQQPNMSDCGVHVILNTKTFFEDPKRTIDLWREGKSRNKASAKAVNEYFDKKGRSNARPALREVLWELQRKQIEINKSNGSSENSDQSRIQDDDDGHSDVEILEDYIEPVVKKKSDSHNEERLGTASDDHPVQARDFHELYCEDKSEVEKLPEKSHVRNNFSKTNEVLKDSSRSVTGSPVECAPIYAAQSHQGDMKSSSEADSNTALESPSRTATSSPCEKTPITQSTSVRVNVDSSSAPELNLEKIIRPKSLLTELSPIESPYFKKERSGARIYTSVNSRLRMPKDLEAINEFSPETLRGASSVHEEPRLISKEGSIGEPISSSSNQSDCEFEEIQDADEAPIEHKASGKRFIVSPRKGTTGL